MAFFVTGSSSGSFGQITVDGDIVPKQAETYDLGTAASPWRDLHVSSGSIKMYAGTEEIARIQVSDDDEFEFFSTKGLSAAQKRTFTKAQIRASATPGKFRGGNIGNPTVSTGSFFAAGIGTTISRRPLHVFRDIDANGVILGRFENPNGESIVEIISQNNTLGILQFGDPEDANPGAIQYDHSGNSMRFKTADGERLRITSGGNVGINKTAPTDTLHVAGGITMEASNAILAMNVTNTTGACQIRFGDTGDSDIGKIVYGHNTNAMSFNTADAERLRIDSSGRIGIGDTSPDTKLHISDDSDVYLTLESTNASTNEEVALKYSNAATSTNYWWVGLNQSNDYSIAYGTIFNAANTRFNILDTGLVGIGTNAPIRALDVVVASGDNTIRMATAGQAVDVINLRNADGRVGFGGDVITVKSSKVGIGPTTPEAIGLHIQKASTDTSINLDDRGHYHLVLQNNDGASQNTGRHVGIMMQINSNHTAADATIYTEFEENGGAKLHFTTTKSGTGAERMVIDSDGNVGIGDTTPSYPLEVAGIIASSAAVGVVRLNGTSSGRIYDLKSNAGRFEIRDNDNGQDRLIIGTNGNVGIGDGLLSPGAKLTVHGDISGSATSTGSFGHLLVGGSQVTAGGGSSVWTTAGSEIYFNNNVGIGTTNPEQLLHLRSANPKIQLEDTSVSNLKHVLSGGDGDAGMAYEADVNNVGAGYHAFKMGGAERIRFIENGNVGIGQTSPAKALHIGNASNNTGNGTIRLQGYSAGGSGNYHDIISYGDNLQFYRNSTLLLHLNYNGRVGIGDTNPTEGKLVVSGNGTAAEPALHLQLSRSDEFNHFTNMINPNMTAGENGIIVFGQEAASKNAAWIGYKHRSDHGNDNQLSLGFWGANNLVNLLPNGKFGIGTETPTSHLHVSASGASARVDGLGGNSALILNNNQSYWEIYNHHGGGGPLKFYNGGADRVTFATNGRVGIGTTSPVAKLDVSGTVTASMFHANASADAGSPEYSFGTDPDTGMYSGGANVLAFSTAGTVRFTLNAGAFSSQTTGGARITPTNGSVAAPTFTFNDDTDTGMFRAAANTIGFGVGGNEGARIDSSQRVGLNGITPGNYYSAYDNLVIGGNEASGMTIRSSTSTSGVIAFADGTSGVAQYQGEIGYNHNSNFLFLNTAGSYRFAIDYSGNVGIGTTSPNAKLEVIGNISGSASSTGSFGKVIGSVDIPTGKRLRVSRIRGRSPVAVDTNETHFNITGSLIVSGARAASRIGTDNFVAETGGTTLLVGSGSQHGFQFINNGSAYSSTPAGRKTILKLVNNAIGLGQQYNNGIEFSPYGNKAYAGIYFYWHGDVTNGRMEFRTTTDTGGSLVTAMTIDENQRVGIGETSPAEKLDVDGSIRINNGGYIDTGATPYEVKIGDNSTTSQYGWFSIKGALDGTTGLRVYPRDEAASISTFAHFSYNGASNYTMIGNASDKDAIVIKTSGNVGIGTTSPDTSRKLTLFGSNAALSIKDNGGNHTFLDLHDGSDHGYLIKNSGTATTNGALAGGLYTYVSSGKSFQHIVNGSPKFTILSGGNVGIGNTNPASDLHITQGGTTGADGIRLTNGGNFLIQAGIIGQTNGGFSIFDVDNNTVRLSIQSNGNVGIGTINPTQKAHIHGGHLLITGGPSDGEANGEVRFTYISESSYGVAAKIAGLRTDADQAKGGALAFYTQPDNSTNGGTERMRIDNTGKVGIGTNAPADDVHIKNGNHAGGHAFGSKGLSLTTSYNSNAQLSVNLTAHRGCYVKCFIQGDWSGHSTIAYLGEFFLQNGAGSYKEPGMVIRQTDNSHDTDSVEAQIVDPAGNGTRDFVIQFKLNQSTGGNTATGEMQYEVMGFFNSIT